MFTKVTNVTKGLKKQLIKKPSHQALRSGKALLSTKLPAYVTSKLPKLVNAPDDVYENLYYQVMEDFALCVQGLPSLRSPRYNHPGGILELGLQRAYTTLAQYRHEHPMKGVKPESMPPKLNRWSYALFTAGLFYGIGDMAANYLISVCDEKGRYPYIWQPFDKPMENFGTHYRYAFKKVKHDVLASRLAPLLAQHILPAEGFAWLASDTEIFDYWLALLQEDITGGGPLARKILLADDKLNKQMGLTGTLPSTIGDIDLTEAENLANELQLDEENIESTEEQERAEEKEHDKDYYSEVTDLDITGIHSEEVGDKFIQWLRNGIIGTTISIDRADSLVSMTKAGTLQISAEIVNDFIKDNPKHTAQEVLKGIQESGYLLETKVSTTSTSSALTSAAQRFNIGAGKNDGISRQRAMALDPTIVFNATHVPPINQETKITAAIMERAYPEIIKASNLYTPKSGK